MSYQGSPYSGHLQDDNDLDDDCYDEYEYRDQEEQPPTAMDDSDEDTEEASETDMGHRDEPQEIKEQIYQDKIANLKKQLQQLRDGAHIEYSRRVRRLEQQLSERQQLNIIHKDYLMECVEQDYILEKKAAAKEFEEKKVDLKENLLTDFEDKRKHIESERLTMELNGDSMEVKPAMTRKLRRRPNEPAPAPDKRRKPLPLTLTYLLDDREVEADLRQISRNRPSAPVAPRKQHAPPPSSMSHMGGNNVENRPPSPMAEARVEDGKLLYERRWYHRGQSIYVEGKDYARFPAHISSIGSDCIWVKKPSVDGNKLRINTSQLARGKMIIKRRAS